ncbi:MAG TPA: GNAT family N-acetyltransferase [Candidatus Nanoarchaeia archaeon]|nr:GNAT family N-acetyltransferase [Candidatus Nanoarchaeia archaeon]
MSAEYNEVNSISEFIDAIRLRVDVFIKEQGFEPGWEPDEDDKVSRHFIAIEAGVVIATARVREPEKQEFKIERMAVKQQHRGKGVGKGLVEFILMALAKFKPKKVWLQSQVKSQPFYEKCGFQAQSKPYDLYGCPHIDMSYISLK